MLSPQTPTDWPGIEREAKVLASLNHPNIGAIYGLEKSGDTRALVPELIEGPTLADRIKQGPIPLDEALPIAKQIAEALEAARRYSPGSQTRQHQAALVRRVRPARPHRPVAMSWQPGLQATWSGLACLVLLVRHCLRRSGPTGR